MASAVVTSPCKSKYIHALVLWWGRFLQDPPQRAVTESRSGLNAAPSSLSYWRLTDSLEWTAFPWLKSSISCCLTFKQEVHVSSGLPKCWLKQQQQLRGRGYLHFNPSVLPKGLQKFRSVQLCGLYTVRNHCILSCCCFIFDNESSIKFNLEMQITVYVCYDRQVMWGLNLNVFQALFLQIANRKPRSQIRTSAYYCISKAARQTLQAHSRAGIHKICKAARGAKQVCCVEHTLHISNQITTLATANPVPAHNIPYCAIISSGSDPKENISSYFIINMQHWAANVKIKPWKWENLLKLLKQGSRKGNSLLLL